MNNSIRYLRPDGTPRSADEIALVRKAAKNMKLSADMLLARPKKAQEIIDALKDIAPAIRKPYRTELIEALEELTKYATGKGESREGNPYAKTAVKKACIALAMEKGHIDWEDWDRE